MMTKIDLDYINRQIIEKVETGLTAKEIGHQLNISKRTVEGRIRKMKIKYECRSLAELVTKIRMQQTDTTDTLQ